MVLSTSLIIAIAFAVFAILMLIVGTHELVWDPFDSNGGMLIGISILTLEVSAFVITIEVLSMMFPV